MNYKLIMTEGATELAFIRILLDRKILKFSTEELLMEQVFNKRQLDGELKGYIQLLPCGDSVDIYRIGDKMTDNLVIPRAILPEKIRDKYKICTLPEFEILFILNERIFDDYMKIKSKMKPSEYYKTIHSDYKKQEKYILDYFSDMSNEDIVKLIDLYYKKHGKAHKNDGKCLKDIIKHN